MMDQVLVLEAEVPEAPVITVAAILQVQADQVYILS
jgi:hypothetical protein